jgi:F-type H+-transporting ATPase subunit epsilon
VAEGMLHVRVVSPEKLIYEGDASALVVPAWDGVVGILPNHAPFLALLGHGKLTIEATGSGGKEYYVAGGVLKVENNQITVLTEYAGAEAPAVVPPEAVIHLDDLALAGNPLV